MDTRIYLHNNVIVILITILEPHLNIYSCIRQRCIDKLIARLLGSNVVDCSKYQAYSYQNQSHHLNKDIMVNMICTWRTLYKCKHYMKLPFYFRNEPQTTILFIYLFIYLFIFLLILYRYLVARFLGYKILLNKAMSICMTTVP